MCNIVCKKPTCCSAIVAEFAFRIIASSKYVLEINRIAIIVLITATEGERSGGYLLRKVAVSSVCRATRGSSWVGGAEWRGL